MSWWSYFDEIYVITLGGDRLSRWMDDATAYKFFYRKSIGVKCDDARKGIYQSFKNIFRYACSMGWSRILIFEDDCRFLFPPDEFNAYMDEIVSQARMIDWWQIKLGSVLIRPVEHLVTPNLFRIEGSYGLHASMYSREFMERALALPEPDPFEPVDIQWMKHMEPEGHCYHSLPLLCSQYSGYSDIDKCERNWDYHIQGAFKKHTSKINLLNSGKLLP